MINDKSDLTIGGPDNTPLTVLGTSNIILNINSNEYSIKVHVINNLSCLIILGNDFLEQNNSVIDFDKKIMTINSISLPIFIDNISYVNQLNTKFNEKVMDLFSVDSNYSFAHCISADLKMSEGIALDICNKYGNMAPKLYKLNPQIGDAIPIVINGRVIYYLITKNYYFEKPEYINIKKALKNLKIQMIKHHDSDIAMPKIASGLDKIEWYTIKEMIISTFHNTNINILICHNNNEYITHNHKKHNSFINAIKFSYDNLQKKESNNKNKNSNNQIGDERLKIFEKYKKGENVLSDGNCGIYSLVNSLNYGKTQKITSVLEILELLNLDDLPNYWFSDSELASLANYYNHDTYVFDSTNKTGIVYGLGNRPPIVLNNVENNKHWIPGVLSYKKSKYIPSNVISFTEFDPIYKLKQSIANHVKKSFNTIEPCNDSITNKSIINNNNVILNINTHIHTNKKTIANRGGMPINILPHLLDSEHKQASKIITKYNYSELNNIVNIKKANKENIPQNYIFPNLSKFNISTQKVELNKIINESIETKTLFNFMTPPLINNKRFYSNCLVVSDKNTKERIKKFQLQLQTKKNLLKTIDNFQYINSINLNCQFLQVHIKSNQIVIDLSVLNQLQNENESLRKIVVELQMSIEQLKTEQINRHKLLVILTQQLKTIVNGDIKIMTGDEHQFRRTLKVLEKNKIEYHRYQLKTGKKFLIVIRELHPDTEVCEIKRVLADNAKKPHTANWKFCSSYKQAEEKIHPKKKTSTVQRLQQKPAKTVTSDVSYAKIVNSSNGNNVILKRAVKEFLKY
ncbi:uncharacterized protein LOC126907216 [Daktulosphaira vitifoliae]|uniref:uncharacterized protein LOC126907216 n=1 Tax=Daktulosphaira vitifoliae TaxID=58002 RepID=UPI0021AA3537|nr:uncharacterized protein LOC126907216 [Daktulosphaira vitifoliae]